LFKSFTGISVQQFDDVYKEIESKYEKYEIKRLSYKRKFIGERAIGAGRHFKLDVRNRIIMVLVYYRLYITYALTEFLFGLNQSNVCRDIQKIEGLIRQCLPIPQKLYKVTRRLKTKEEVERYFPGFLAFVDVTEQPIPRPKNKLRRRIYYSGKRKKHTVKNLYTVNEDSIIIYKSKHKQIGKKHDYNIYKKNHPKLPKEVVSMFDLGFLGIQKDFTEQKSSLPIKKEKDCELSLQEKDYNKNHSKKRIVIEHAICRLKKFSRILADVFRNKLRKYDSISNIVSGLVNYRIMNPSYTN
jgi:hypothetical protein